MMMCEFKLSCTKIAAFRTCILRHCQNNLDFASMMVSVRSSRGLQFLALAAILIAFLHSAGASHGRIPVKWDILFWTADGYRANVTIYDSQHSYQLGWHWAKKEVIYIVVGANVTEQGDCTGYPYPPPASCLRDPTIVDIEVANSVSSFSLTVGYSGNTNVTIKIPESLTLTSIPGSAAYNCTQLTKVAPTRFPSPDGKHVTQAYVTWNATC